LRICVRFNDTYSLLYECVIFVLPIKKYENMKLTTEQLENGLKYEIDLSRKLKKELKRIEEELKKCQERMVDYNRELNNSKQK
jgi:septal ring factor EnvC (AmiA/AmiB activator)